MKRSYENFFFLFNNPLFLQVTQILKKIKVPKMSYLKFLIHSKKNKNRKEIFGGSGLLTD
jgi:hypothetical protein